MRKKHSGVLERHLKDVLDRRHVPVDWDNDWHVIPNGPWVQPNSIEEDLFVDDDEPREVNPKDLAKILKDIENSDLERLVNLGSVFEYGSKSNSIKETDPTQPFDPYSVTKVSQTKLVEEYSRQKKLPAVTLRIFTPYGIFEEPGRLISDLMVATVKKKPLKIRSRKSKRDFVYIDDVTSALIKASNKPGIEGEIFNIGSGSATSVEDLVNLVCKVTDINLEVSWPDENQRENDKMNANGFADIQKAKKIDWKPEVSLKDGLSRTYEWFLQNIKLY